MKKWNSSKAVTCNCKISSQDTLFFTQGQLKFKIAQCTFIF